MKRSSPGVLAVMMVSGAAMLLLVTSACAPASAQGTAQPAQPIPAGVVPVASGPGGHAPESGGSPVRVVVIGDSLSTGLGTSPEQAWPELLQSANLSNNRPVQVTNAAENGSGYLVAGDDGDNFTMEVQAAVSAEADVVVFFGSDNDEGAEPEELRDATVLAFAAASSVAPNAVLVAVGPLSGSEETDPTLADVRDVEASAAQYMGVDFIDPIAEQWFSSRADTLLGPDGEHPSAEGQEFLRDKMQGIVSAAVQG
ncbi:SGNH/GDSL hydrolase family protein [Pseudarthrobacter sulfonivorans]|uniref:SGNH/GDSL hydrolase family protein n=1 Tax=Pseudarthrobacter sulfonivorans TaxID=121292 RepID=UPI002104B5A7|nr:SGNH/GDSL hydrolase family protein [Pseudarthrobacter sulfonivorans]